MNSFLHFFQPPQYENEYEHIPTKILHVLLICIFGGVGILGLVGSAFVFQEKLITTITIISTMGIAIWGIHGNRRGNTIPVARFIFGLLWLLITAVTYLSQGTQSIDMMFYISGTVTTGLVLGATSTVIYAVASAAVTLLMLILSSNNLIQLPDMFPFPCR